MASTGPFEFRGGPGKPNRFLIYGEGAAGRGGHPGSAILGGSPVPEWILIVRDFSGGMTFVSDSLQFLNRESILL